LRSCWMMLWHKSIHSGQMKILFGPSMNVSTWLDDRPQKLQIALGFLLFVRLAIITFLFSN